MNILTDVLPTTVQIADTEYRLNSDFRNCLRILMAFEDNDLALQEKQTIMLVNMYGETIPQDLQEAVKQALWFLNCGEESNNNEQLRLFSFAHDARFIFAAFKQTHDIDLETTNLHWWKFQALFMDLGQDTTFCQLVSLRKRHKQGKTTKEERAAIRDMEDIFTLPEIDTRTDEEKTVEDRFWQLVEEGKKNREQAQKHDG